jgi:NAD(P)-dependent dehydrogenase (short-subunit alcohol dehydrogenase family)
MALARGGAMLTVLITGSNRGIGLELARQYAQAGDTVLATCRSPQSATALNTLARDTDGRVSVHAMDVANEESIAQAAKALAKHPIDVLINNAGVFGGEHQSLERTDTAPWLEAFKVMAIGPFRVVQAFLPNLLMAKDPKITIITSQMGASTWPMGGSYAYGSAKAAANRIGMALARDLKDRAIVALIHPGWVRTDMGGPNADIAPEESAASIRKVIAGLKRSNSGKFYKWNGDVHPW